MLVHDVDGVAAVAQAITAHVQAEPFRVARGRRARRTGCGRDDNRRRDELRDDRRTSCAFPRSTSFDLQLYSTGGAETYLVKVPYNGEVGAAPGCAALKHTGRAAEVQTTSVTEFLTGSAATNKDFIYVGAAGSFAAGAGVSSGVVIDNRTGLNITNGLSTANIYYGTHGVASTTKSTIVQRNQQF